MPVMSRSRINRYLYQEILGPALLALLVFTLVLILGRLVKLVDLVINKGVSIWDIIVLFGTLLPSFLGISLPLALLMGIMIGLSRMSGDNETVALKAAGISLTNIAIPVFSIALVFAILTGAAGLWAEPWGYRAFKTKVFEITRQKASIGLRPQVFMNQFDNLVFYAGDVDNRSGQFRKLFIIEQRDDRETLILADRGQVSSNDEDQTVTIHLADGAIHRQGEGADGTYQIIRFKQYDVHPQIDASATARARTRFKPKEMATAELQNALKQETDAKKLHALSAELHQRFSAPLAPLLFTLFALPFGIQSSRSGRSGGIVMGLMIYLCYYFMISFADTLVSEGDASPWLAIWGLHLAMLIGGIVMLYRSSQEKPNLLAVWVNRLLTRSKPGTP